jgi:WD40 repeat protein
VFSSPDGRLISVSNDRGETAVVDVSTGAVVDTFRGDAAWFGDDGRLAVVVDRQNLSIWDPATKQAEGVWPGIPGGFDLSSDFRLLVLVSPLGTAIVFRDTQSGEEVRRVPADAGRAFLDVWLLDDGQHLLTVEGSAKDCATIDECHSPVQFVMRDLASFEPSRSTTPPGVTGLSRYAVSADGRWLAVGQPDGAVSVVDLRGGEWRELRGRHRAPLRGLAFTPDSTMLVTTGDDRVALLWNVVSGSLVETLAGHTGAVYGPAFSPDGATLYTAGEDGSVIVWDVAGQRRLARPFRAGDGNKGLAWGSGYPAFTLHAVSPDGKLLAVPQLDGYVVVRDARTLDELDRFRAILGGATPLGLAWSPDSRSLAVSGSAGQIGLWDARSGRAVVALDGLSGTAAVVDAPFEDVQAVAFSPDGSILAGLVGSAAHGGAIHLWDPRSGALLGAALTLPVSGGVAVNFGWDVAVAPDGTTVAATHGGVASVWRLSDRTLLFTVPVDEDSALAPTVAYSPDGRLLATGGGDGVVRFWNATTGERAGDPVAVSAGWVATVSFSPDGRLLATAASEGTVRLVDVRTRDEIGTPLPGLVNESASAAFTPDGKRLVVVYATGDGLVWDVDPDAWKQRACAVAGRALTRAEWQKFLPGRAYEPACSP